MKKKLIYFILCLMASLPGFAQKFYNDAIIISNASLWQQGQSLYINILYFLYFDFFIKTFFP